MIDIIITNTKCKVICNPVEMDELREKFKIRAKGAFFSPAFKKRQWDGFVRYIDHNGFFEAGLLPKIRKFIKEEMGLKIQYSDNRTLTEPDETITELGGMTLRPYQLDAVASVFNNKIGKRWFPRCILKEATNGGKNIISAAIFSSMPEGSTFFFLIHSQLIYTQALKEMTELLGESQIGMVDSKRFILKKFNICMVQTLSVRLKDPTVQRALAKAEGLIVDECHRAGSKQYGSVLKYLYNCPIRIGVSGTPLDHKDKNINEKIESFFGPIIHTISNQELVEQGYSTEPIIKILLGETKYPIGFGYAHEYETVITGNKKRTKRIWKRVRKQIEKKRLPLLILCKFIQHAKNMLKLMPKDLRESLKVGVIHVKVKNRKAILQEFKDGKLDILIATHIIKEGQNMPLIKYAINTGGSDSAITIIQWLGRMLRKHHTKSKVYIDDIYDLGIYLKRHSKHRVKFYKDQGFRVLEIHKKTAKRKSIKIY